MKERGINNTFKKIIFESSEMVFLADDSYPYNIFYSNQAFENQIGQFLDERSLVGLGLDINSYIFNEELILTFMGVEYTFFLELPQENASNYFLFYKGKELRGQGLPNKNDSQYFFRNSIDLIGIGQESFLTWVSNSVKTVLGYNPDEIINIELCGFFHQDDLEVVKSLLFDVRQERKNTHFEARLQAKNGEYRWFEFNVHFIVGKFYAVAREITDFKSKILQAENLNELYTLGEKLSQIGFWEIDAQANSVYFSDELYKIFALNKNTKLSLEDTIELFQPADRSLVKTSLSSLISSSKEIDLVLQVKAGEDGMKWIRLSGSAHVLTNNVSRIFGTIQDISKDQEYLGQLDFYKELYTLTPDPSIILDLSGRIQFFNTEAQRKLLADSTQQFPQTIEQLDSHFTEKQVWENHLSELGTNGQKLHSVKLKNAKGDDVSFEIISKLVQIKGANYIISNFREISESHVTATTQAAPDFLSHLTEHIPGALYQFVVDKEGEMKFNYLSPGIKSLLDLDEKELSDFKDVGKVIAKVHPEDIANVLTSTVSSARKLTAWSCKFRIVEPGSKNYKWVMGAAKPELQENGDVVWYGYLTDITDQKRFEEKLRDAKEEALKTSQVKSEFLSIISHELRTPLNAISGSVYSLLQDEHTPVQASAFKTINFAVDNLIAMINDLLDFQKIDAGKLTLEMSPMNLEEVIKNVISGLEYHAKDSGNKLTLHLKSDLDFEVKGDKTRLAQVLNNLITNALKFTDNGNVDVTVELKEKNDSKVKVYFEVKDNGIGIADEHKQRIFNEFDQIQHSFSKKYGGTGLGLSITKKLLGLMDSQIDLHSELGVGSTFFFEIEFEKVFGQSSLKPAVDHKPVVEVKPILPETQKPEIPESKKETTAVDNEKGKEVESKVPVQSVNRPKSLSDVKLLMAEDNDVNALVLGKIIKKWGIQFHRVNNGKLAVEAVQDGDYDCVLMDIQMPVMNGFDATEKIKEISNVPVLALSAADKIEVMDRIDKTGFDGYVAKPIDASELLRKIKEVLKISSQSV
ncbi:ATP-binding protein [Cecembia rubra]|uniref:PAS domain-containing hybrid sensor histidine kinase/response regulator n=1 Tax=Cecembia rubra TaxID=1485585 RepID=UPI002714D241|nr:ATP-binding protein [Cecembia rubra]